MRFSPKFITRSKAVLVGPLGHQADPTFGQRSPQGFASVSEIVSEELAGEIVSEVRLGEQFLRQAHLRDVGGGELVGEGDAVGGADERGSFTP
jgi:hypothetical protein